MPTLLEAGTLPELEPLQAHLGPDPQSLPQLDVRLGSPADYNDLLDHLAALATPRGRTVRTRYVTVHSGHELAMSSSSLDGYWITADAAPSLQTS